MVKVRSFDTVKITGIFKAYFPVREIRVRNLLAMVAAETDGIPTRFWVLDLRSPLSWGFDCPKIYIVRLDRVRPYHPLPGRGIRQYAKVEA